jgi:hypothetical protein
MCSLPNLVFLPINFLIRFWISALRHREGLQAHIRISEEHGTFVFGAELCKLKKYQFDYIDVVIDRLCGLVVRVLGYRSGGPGSIPGTTRKKSSGSGTESTQPREYN